jgi:hypothetical protein
MKVYAAINKVQAEIAKVGIAKDRNNQAQGFKFRGIDDVYNALAPLIPAAGLVILPRVISREVTERASKNGGAIFYVNIVVEYDFVCAEDATKHTVVMVGEAMDSADKATNKALSAAYKYACFQVFCIPTEGDNDADGQHQVVISEEARARERLENAKEQYAESVQAILTAFGNEDHYAAAEAWFELPQDAKQALWVAPTKGGPFSTRMREIMRSEAFRKAYFGDAEAKESANATP